MNTFHSISCSSSKVVFWLSTCCMFLKFSLAHFNCVYLYVLGRIQCHYNRLDYVSVHVEWIYHVNTESAQS